MADQYNGSIGLAAGIVAKGGTFPLVNETDIYVSGDPTGTWTNLSTKLSDMSATISSINTKVGSVATTEDIEKLFGTTDPTEEEKKKIINLAGLELFNEYVSMIDADELLFDVDSPNIT